MPNRAVADLSVNTRMAAIARSLIEQIERLTWLARHTSRWEGVARACAEHEAIIDAVQARDSVRASRLCYEHAHGARQRVSTALQLSV